MKRKTTIAIAALGVAAAFLAGCESSPEHAVAMPDVNATRPNHDRQQQLGGANNEQTRASVRTA